VFDRVWEVSGLSTISLFYQLSTLHRFAKDDILKLNKTVECIQLFKAMFVFIGIEKTGINQKIL
jgi:hypothetical protein